MPRINKYAIAALLATIASLSFSISMLFVKQLSKDLNVVMIILTRNLIGLAILTPLFIKQRVYKTYPKRPLLYLIRITLIISAMLCTYYAYRHLPIGFATTIGMSGALSTTILSTIILREKIKNIQWIMVIIGYLGVLLVIKPNSFVLEYATIIALLANIISAFIIIITKLISIRDAPSTIVCYSTFGVVLLSLFLAYTTKQFQLISPKDLLLLLGSGALGTLTQFCWINALKYSSPAFAAPFEYSRLIFGVLIGMFVFNEFPDIYMIFGGFTIIASTYFITYTKIKSQ